jgi:DNA repair protein RecN (Recombination protein N)
MLEKLHIKNFVLIEELTLNFKKGLNILTGETGAGKSILIGAISGILGDRMTTDMIRTGFERATLEGTFEISNLLQVKNILIDSGIDTEENILIIKREIYSSGKGRCFANSTQIPIVKLKEISEYLLDIHGQNEHQSIVRVAKHRELLDNYAENQHIVAEIRALHKELQTLKESLEASAMDEREKARRLEYLKFAAEEVKQAALQPNEEEELKEESNILSNSEKLFTAINNSSNLIDADSGVLDNLKKIEKYLSSIAEFDSNIASNLETVCEALYSLEDSALFLRNYKQNIDFSTERLNEVESRLSLISSMKKKYGDTIQEIIKYGEKCSNELESISSSEERIENLKIQYQTLIKKAKETSLNLSERRTVAAKELEANVIKELKDLNMQDTVLRVSVKREINPIGDIEHNNNKYVLYPHGLDKIEFLLSANAGESLHQLRKVASGGEMSRIMLAIKKVILSNDIVETLIFDEVDTGISGKTAEIVGKKLKSLANKRQVFVITHLPQIAAMSDNHFTVSKETINSRTITRVKNLEEKEKIAEVARMLAGEKITDLSLKHAEEMIKLAVNA